LAIIPPLLDLIFTIGAPHRERRGNAGQHTGGKLTPLHRLDNLLSLESRRIISGSERRAGGSGIPPVEEFSCQVSVVPYSGAGTTP
jgi:hypothetical protein